MMKMKTRSKEFYFIGQRFKCCFEHDGFVFGCFIKKKVWYGWKRVYKNPYLTILHLDTFLTWSDETFDTNIDATVNLFINYSEQ